MRWSEPLHPGLEFTKDRAKTVHVVFKYQACCLKWCGGGRSNPSPLVATTLFPSWFVHISFKDDVAVNLLLYKDPGIYGYLWHDRNHRSQASDTWAPDSVQGRNEDTNWNIGGYCKFRIKRSWGHIVSQPLQLTFVVGHSISWCFFCLFFWRATVIAHFVFLRDVWIRTQRAALASRRSTKLATHLPFFMWITIITNNSTLCLK